MLFYRGEVPEGWPADANIASLSGPIGYPLSYGYAVVGEVVWAGRAVAPGWLGRRVFAFQPHSSHFTARPSELIVVPPDVADDDALFVANMESAVNLLMDARPVIGEKVVVLGQGVVGLLTTALLSRFPLGRLVTVDRHQLRRQRSLTWGADASLDPAVTEVAAAIRRQLATDDQPSAADLVLEVSGDPAAINLAVDVSRFAGRVVVGSWYGTRRAELDLGRAFHRLRLRLISSQVSTLAPELSGNWTKKRRFELVWAMIRALQPSGLITHRFAVEQAPDAYRLLDRRPEEALQLVFRYDEKG
jgi:threonine dehydrogenase-like Zn-dependent dehydrogenase